MLKLKMMLCVMMLLLVVVGAVSSPARQPRVKLPHFALAWIMQPPTGVTPKERGLFHPQREVDHSGKNNWKEPRSILMSSDRVAHIDGQLMQLL